MFIQGSCWNRGCSSPLQATWNYNKIHQRNCIKDFGSALPPNTNRKLKSLQKIRMMQMEFSAPSQWHGEGPVGAQGSGLCPWVTKPLESRALTTAEPRFQTLPAPPASQHFLCPFSPAHSSCTIPEGPDCTKVNLKAPMSFINLPRSPPPLSSFLAISCDT